MERRRENFEQKLGRTQNWGVLKKKMGHMQILNFFSTRFHASIIAGIIGDISAVVAISRGHIELGIWIAI